IHAVDLGVSFSFSEIQLAALEGNSIRGIRKIGPSLRQRQAAELRQELAPAAPDELGQISVVVCKNKKGPGSRKLLALERHGRSRRKQQERGQRFVPAATR